MGVGGGWVVRVVLVIVVAVEDGIVLCRFKGNGSLVDSMCEIQCGAGSKSSDLSIEPRLHDFTYIRLCGHCFKTSFRPSLLRYHTSELLC